MEDERHLLFDCLQYAAIRPELLIKPPATPRDEALKELFARQDVQSWQTLDDLLHAADFVSESAEL